MAGGRSKFVFTPTFVVALIAITAFAATTLADSDWLATQLQALIRSLIIAVGIVGALHGIGLGLLRSRVDMASLDSDTGVIRRAVAVGRELERRNLTTNGRPLRSVPHGDGGNE